MTSLDTLHRLSDSALDLILFHLIEHPREPLGTHELKSKSSKEIFGSLTLESWTNLKSFRMVDRRLNHVYESRFPRKRTSILDFPAEILHKILEYNTHIKKELVKTDKKASLSVESFAVPVPSREDFDRIANFRLVCRRFSELGTDCQFARVITRFSRSGFDRLRWVAEQPHLASKVKQFSYMMPRIYTQERRCFELMLEEAEEVALTLLHQIAQRRKMAHTQNDRLQPTTAQLEGKQARHLEYRTRITQAIAKLEQQKEIIEKRIDFEQISFALKSFSNLVQIRFMKIANDADDAFDAGLARFLQAHPEHNTSLQPFEWNIACEHSANILTEALLAADAQKFSRLSSRFIDPRTPLNLSSDSRASMLAVAKRLNSLELDFDNRINLNEQVGELTELFGIMFSESDNLQNLHVGFRRPISVPVETVFRGVTLAKLIYLGLHQWELECEELVKLIIRHRRHLKYLRLRYVCLREGTWATVLKAVRLNVELGWVSLRGICYPPTQLGGLNFEPAPGLPLNQSDGNESDPEDHWTGSGDENTDLDDDDEETDVRVEQSEEAEYEDDNEDASEGSEDESGSEDENESVLGNAVRGGSGRASPLLHHPGPVQAHLNDGQRSLPPPTPGRCYCTSGYGWFDLVDEGAIVKQDQWKYWQEWLTRRCLVHDLDAAKIDPGFE